MSTPEQDELMSLWDTFAQVERQSAVKYSVESDRFFCIRLDGFKHSKRHLKDVLVNHKYNDWLYGCIKDTYMSFRKHLDMDYMESFLCACSFSDEVTFVLLKGESRYERRVLKYCTLFSGIMSSAMTKRYCVDMKCEGKMVNLFFDARPLVLDDTHNVSRYIRSRHLLATRQAYWKVLRLRDYPGCNEDRIKGSLDESRRLVRDCGWQDDYTQIANTFKFYMPLDSGQGDLVSYTLDEDFAQVSALEKRLRERLSSNSSART